MLTAAASEDLTDLNTVWTELGITSGPADPYLSLQITSASKYLATQCNRTFAVETVRDDFTVSGVYGGSYTWCGDYVRSLFLSRWPIVPATTPPDDTVPAIVLTEGGVTLVEDTDFTVDYATGELLRINADGTTYWPVTAISVTYTAGYVTPPADLVEGVLRIVRARYYAQKRDPALKGEVVPGVYEAQYWISDSAMGGNMTPDVSDIIDNYKRLVAV